MEITIMCLQGIQCLFQSGHSHDGVSLPSDSAYVFVEPFIWKLGMDVFRMSFLEISTTARDMQNVWVDSAKTTAQTHCKRHCVQHSHAMLPWPITDHYDQDSSALAMSACIPRVV